MIETTYKGVKIELEMNQNEDGNWVARCSLKWPDGITEHFAGKYALSTERSAHASALAQVHQYIDRRIQEPKQGLVNMAKVKVYRVKVFDGMTDRRVISRRMATREGAATMRGEVLEDTEIEIDESQLEPGEQWTPVDFKP
jgi:hypothetical protein